MASIAEIDRVIGGLQSQYEAKKAQNRDIQAKIDALEEAKRIMSDALGKAESLREEVGKQKVDGWWNGSLADEVTGHVSTSRDRANDVAQGIKDGIGDINGHILKLRTEYDYIVGLISGIEDALTAKDRERRQAIAEAGSSSAGSR